MAMRNAPSDAGGVPLTMSWCARWGLADASGGAVPRQGPLIQERDCGCFAHRGRMLGRGPQPVKPPGSGMSSDSDPVRTARTATLSRSLHGTTDRGSTRRHSRPAARGLSGAPAVRRVRLPGQTRTHGLIATSRPRPSHIAAASRRVLVRCTRGAPARQGPRPAGCRRTRPARCPVSAPRRSVHHRGFVQVVAGGPHALRGHTPCAATRPARPHALCGAAPAVSVDPLGRVPPCIGQQADHPWRRGPSRRGRSRCPDS